MLLDDLLKIITKKSDWIKKVSSNYYKKNFASLIIDCETALKSKNALNTYLCLPRLARVALDNYAITPSINNRLLIDQTVKTITDSFKDYDKGLNGLKSILFNNDFIVYEPEDYTTLYCLNPVLINDYITKVKEHFSEDFVFTNLGNGSTRIALLMIPSIEDQIIDYVPFRLSMYKHKDKIPNISQNDLNRLSSGNKLFITDEDRTTGKTLQACKNYLQSKGFKEVTFGTITTTTCYNNNLKPNVYAEIIN